MTGKLIIARHHESEWNKLGKWTGKTDVHLTPYGMEKSAEMGALIRGTEIDCAFASVQVRALETLEQMEKAAGLHDVPLIRDAALNERDYGDYTGKNKWQMKELLGEDRFSEVRRGWDCPIPNGETLKMVSARTLPYFLNEILPLVLKGENVLVVAHGNSLRAIMKYIENIPDDKIGDVEMPFGAVIIYDLDNEGRMLHKEVRSVESSVPA